MMSKTRFEIACDDLKVKLEKISPVRLVALETTLDQVTPLEVITYQSLQAEAHASGLLQTDDAMWLYERLGRENPTVEKWRALALAEKVFISQLLMVFMTVRRKAQEISPSA